MKKKIGVLGAGLVGKAIAADLAKEYDVTSADINEEALNEVKRQGVRTETVDIADANALTAFIKPFDLVIGAVPGFLGYRTARVVIDGGKNMVDISFFPEDPFSLDDLAKKKQVTVITDCGVAPGMGNIVLGYHHRRMKVNSYECLVGGLPVIREWPYEYKAVFSPIDVIEEYVRPARFVVNGTLVVRDALSDAALVDIDGVGTLESWNSDGLRTLIKTMPDVPNMIEKTLRYPGCIEYLRVLRESGFFSYDEIDINGVKVRPVDVTARLLFPRWKLKPGEKEFTAMRIRVAGEEQGRPRRYEYSVLDHTDEVSGTLSMARTTGYTCTAAARLVVEQKFTHKGICPPEYLGEEDEHFNYVLAHLRARQVTYHVKQW